MEILCRKLKKDFDYVFIDCPAGIGSGLDISMAGADRALLVTEADMAAVRDADVLNRYLKKEGLRDTCYLVNKIRADLMARHLVPDLREIAEILNSRLVGVIQFDDNIYISTNRGIPIVAVSYTHLNRT